MSRIRLSRVRYAVTMCDITYKVNANECKESLLLVSRVQLDLCKVNANEWKESLLLVSRVQLDLCKDNIFTIKHKGFDSIL